MDEYDKHIKQQILNLISRLCILDITGYGYSDIQYHGGVFTSDLIKMRSVIKFGFLLNKYYTVKINIMEIRNKFFLNSENEIR